MFHLFASPEQLLREETPTRLVLTRPHLFKFWAAVALILAAVSAGFTISLGLNLVGSALVAFYAGLAAWLLILERTVTIDATSGYIVFTTYYLQLRRQTRAIPVDQIDSVYLDYEEH